MKVKCHTHFDIFDVAPYEFRDFKCKLPLRDRLWNIPVVGRRDLAVASVRTSAREWLIFLTLHFPISRPENCERQEYVKSHL